MYPTPGGPGLAGKAGPVAILLPLSGTGAERGQSMLKAAQLALDAPGAPPLDARDTGGTPDGAATAAREAIAAGAGLILGPLTSSETAAVAPAAKQAGVPVLAFTNDAAQAQPGVWTLGITPLQQVRRVVGAAQAKGSGRFAGLLPDNDFGRAMSVALQQATSSLDLPPPSIRQYARGMASVNAAVRDISDYANRGGGIDARIRAARARGDAEAKQEAAELSRSRNIAPPPFDALLLADTGEPLAEIASLLSYYDVHTSSVRILGPALWAVRSTGAGQFPGAWYAAPDPAARAGFDERYAAKFGAPAPAIADLAFDAASIARVLAGSGGFSASGLTHAEGFAGVDGLLVLQPDGQVRRGLAIFEVQRGGNAMIEPAPQNLSAPGV
jgi:branched-chain amino acid transport system substrate-binding protein